MQHKQQNGQRVTELWATDMANTSQQSHPSLRTPKDYLPIWLAELFIRLRLARKIEIDDYRRKFIQSELRSMGYDVWQAKRAEAWIIHGNWQYRGQDPTLELSDFTPTAEQYAETVAKLTAKARPQTQLQPEARKEDYKRPDAATVQAFRDKLETIYNTMGATTR